MTRITTHHRTFILLLLALVAVAAILAFPATVEGQQAGAEDGFAQTAEAIRPSVVSVTAERAAPNLGNRLPQFRQRPPRQPDGPGDDQGLRDRLREQFRNFRDFDGDEGLERRFEAVPEDLLRRFQQDLNRQGFGGGGDTDPAAAGSGLVFDDKGHVLTAHHVVEGARAVTVHVPGGRSVPASVVGADPITGLAVVKLNDTQNLNLRAAKFGNSDEVRLGQSVLAAGAMHGSGDAGVFVTSGIISAKAPVHVAGGRPGGSFAPAGDVLFTNAELGDASGGGALVNLRGEVIGVSIAALGDNAGGAPRLGVAIPGNLARDVAQQLAAGGRVARGYLGVSIQDLDEGLAKSFEFPLDQGQRKGVLVGEVMPGSPAARAGLQAGDIIVSFDGKPAAGANDLRAAVARVKPGAKAAVEVWRDGKTQKLDVEVTAMPGQAALAGGRGRGGDAGAADDAGGGRFGLALSDGTPQLREQAGVGEDAKGAFVAAVAPNSPAARAGVQQGDLILDVHGQRVNSAEEARKALTERDPKEGVRLRVQRGDSTQFVFIRGGGGGNGNAEPKP